MQALGGGTVGQPKASQLRQHTCIRKTERARASKWCRRRRLGLGLHCEWAVHRHGGLTGQTSPAPLGAGCTVQAEGAKESRIKEPNPALADPDRERK